MGWEHDLCKKTKNGYKKTKLWEGESESRIQYMPQTTE